MSLLHDMLPDPMWSTRGGTDRDGSVLTMRRAKVLAASAGIAQSMAQFTFILAVYFAIPNNFAIIILAFVGFLIIVSADHNRRVSLLPIAMKFRVSDLVRIGIVLAFVLPIILHLVSRALGRFDPATFSILLGDKFGEQLSLFSFLLLINGLPIYNDWTHRRAALQSADPDMEMIFVPKQALSTKKASI